MATKPIKKVVRKAATNKVTKKPVTAKVSQAKVAPATGAHKVLLAGLGAATRVQDNALKVYGMLASEANRLTSMTSEAAQTLAARANVFAREGQKIQSQTVGVAEAKARDAAKELAAFAKKSEQAFKQNVSRVVGATVAGAKDGVSQLEQVFESRVAKTLNTFGVPSAQNVRELQANMAELQKALTQLNKRGVRV